MSSLNNIERPESSLLLSLMVYDRPHSRPSLQLCEIKATIGRRGRGKDRTTAGEGALGKRQWRKVQAMA